MNWIKENWFKIAIVVLVAIYLLLSRYSFYNEGGAFYLRCDNFLGVCDFRATR